jgi:integrase/recombinase XerD
LFINHYRGTLKSSKSTVEAYRSDLEDFERFLVRRAGSIVNPSERDVQDYFAEQEKSGLAAATRRRRYAALCAFAEYRKEEGIDLPRILREMGRPPLRKTPPKSLKPEQIERLIAAPKPDSRLYLRDVAILRLFASAVRVSELCDLKTADVVLQTNSLRVGKPGRNVPLGNESSAALRAYQSECRPKLLRSSSQSFFLSRTGKKLDRVGVWMVVKKYAKEAGVSAAPSALRHSCATRHLKEGVAPAFVQGLLGHSRLGVTKGTYAKAIPRRM